ncbi:MAG: hypothetical protein ACM3X4_10550 [Ignavibacteriales bacterium]
MDPWWIGLIGSDPCQWIMESDEPAAKWIILKHVLGRPDDDPGVRQARAGVLDSAPVRELIASLPDWEEDAQASGHNSMRFIPNMLNLLADMGVGAGDDPGIESILDKMLLHQAENGRFQAFGRIARAGDSGPSWGSLLCDTHAIIEVLIRFGRASDPRVIAGITRMGEDVASTRQGTAWPCVPHSSNGFRGPGRKDDFCPQVTLEALRAYSRLPEGLRPGTLLDAARACARAWLNRSTERPYMFGHGYRFKTVKWPPFWYDVCWVLDTLGRYPDLWQGDRSSAADRRAVAEMTACMIAYNFGPGGLVTPRSCYLGFPGFSFGQKKRPSPFATARLISILHRFHGLEEDIASVDVPSLGSSKGGSGVARPPRHAP